MPSTASDPLTRYSGRNGCSDELVGEPLFVQSRLPRVEDFTQPNEEPLDPVICLVGVPVGDFETAPLRLSHRIENPSHLHQVGLMVATESVELASHQQPEEAQMAWPPYPGVDERTEGVDDARADDHLAGDVQFRSTGWTTPTQIQWRTGHWLSPRNICTESRSSIGGTLARRSERTVIP